MSTNFDPEKSACLLGTIEANVDNKKLSDTEFRQFIRNSLSVAELTDLPTAKCCQAVRILNKLHCSTWRCPVCYKEV